MNYSTLLWETFHSIYDCDIIITLYILNVYYNFISQLYLNKPKEFIHFLVMLEILHFAAAPNTILFFKEIFTVFLIYNQQTVNHTYLTLFF